LQAAAGTIKPLGYKVMERKHDAKENELALGQHGRNVRWVRSGFFPLSNNHTTQRAGFSIRGFRFADKQTD